MKKIVSSVLVCVLLLSTVFVLASCAKQLNGEYTSALGVTYEFEGNKVTRKWTLLGNTISKEGEYSIKEDKITFTFGSEGEEYSGTYDFVEGSEGETVYIKIDGMQYNKK